MTRLKSSKNLQSLVDNHVSVVGDIIEFLLLYQQQNNQDLISLVRQKENQLLASYINLTRINFENLLDVIKDLPILPIVPDTDLSLAFINQQREMYQAKGMWLRAALLEKILDFDELKDYFRSSESDLLSLVLDIGRGSLSGEVVNRSFPLAYLSSLILALAREAYPKSKDLQILFPSADIFWICWEFSQSRFWLREAGVTDLPIIRSKRETNNYIASSVENFDLMHLEDQKKLAAKNLRNVDRSEHLIDLLLNELARLSQEGDLDDLLYEKFLRYCKRVNNVIRNDVAFQGHYLLPDNQIFSTGKNVKIPDSYSAQDKKE
jgi:hypothetical protein